MKKLANLLALLSAAMGSLLFIKNKAPNGFALWMPKLMAGALAPFWAMAGLFGAVLGLRSGAPLAVLAGLFGTIAGARYTRLVAHPHIGFSQAFGPDWEGKIPPSLQRRMLQRRWSWRMPPAPEPRWQPDFPFWTLPATEAPTPIATLASIEENSVRRLLCDLWQPTAEVKSSGLALIYFHGSAWYLMDKDIGTRPFFRHLAAQGHVVMDVAYRLAPETDIAGMVGDVKRAIAWMKENAAGLNVNPERIVLCGGSAGGHISLLAAYAPDHPDLTPDDVKDRDLRVRAVISEYGPVDLEACYSHTNQDKTTGTVAGWYSPGESLPHPQPDPVSEEGGMNRLMRSWMGDRYERMGLNKGPEAGALIHLLGCHPTEFPERYAQLSPVTYVHPGCPPTLLIQGEDDLITPVAATRELYRKLVDAGVPAVNVVFPQTDHGFDLMLPEFSPSAQAALYDIERFLALMV